MLHMVISPIAMGFISPLTVPMVGQALVKMSMVVSAPVFGETVVLTKSFCLLSACFFLFYKLFLQFYLYKNIFINL